MADEIDIARGVVQIANANGGLCTYKRAYREVPNHVQLSAANTAPSIKRPGEPMLHQLVRNIKSHQTMLGNFVHDGRLVHVPRVGFRVP
ncbi:hypothetical protein JKL49_11300 [Phenylobacterium sp. 20VBR1]|uniref:Uncharacterized protein n=1 Tax=Phenylobacterium glaciei TaxID=2803784 RepID=A0A941D313_9CAUL|nr:hypothetical protein [Phenylobacterium glaciei]MBR7619976.1 hypothetical protein [Phenylobacterium glaciei]QQZ48889.1 hypothetical protein JKL49_16510 [Phenylobacterium glaciei]